jgi:hypothetical protein
VRRSHDPKRNSAYPRRRDAAAGEIATVGVSAAVNIDRSPDGPVCGSELLNANKQPADRQRVLDRGAKQFEVPLPQTV